MSGTVFINKGSDTNMRGVWPGQDGPFSLTDWDLEIYDASPEISPFLSASIGEAQQGEFWIRLEWDEQIPVGPLFGFRIQISQGPEQISTPIIAVRFK